MRQHDAKQGPLLCPLSASGLVCYLVPGRLRTFWSVSEFETTPDTETAVLAATIWAGAALARLQWAFENV